MNTYFDLHLHPSSKPFLTGSPLGPKKEDCWTALNPKIDMIGSQSSLNQLSEGRVNVAVACLYALETPFTYNFVIEHLVPLLTFVEASAMRFEANDNAYNRLMAELKLLKESLQNKPDAAQIIQSYKGINPTKLNLILAVEGAHCFGPKELLLNNFKAFKTNGHRLLYLTLTHLTRAACASHAYSIKLIKRNDQFKPGGGGLLPLGKDVIDAAYDKSIGGHQVFIDIKHMGLHARKQFYKYREEEKPEYKNIPIIASHVACTGLSWYNIPGAIKERLVKEFETESEHSPENKYVVAFYKDVPGLSGTKFNPISINLYDEEIEKIIESGGLIGLMMEKKSLGLHKRASEFFELDEFNRAVLRIRDAEKSKIDEKDFAEDIGPESNAEELEELLDARKRKNYELHLKYLANQILHIVKIGGAKAWDHICIGSDFDGLVSAVRCCFNASEYKFIANDLPGVINKMAQENPHPDNYYITDATVQVGKFCYGNAMTFLAKHWSDLSHPAGDPVAPAV